MSEVRRQTVHTIATRVVVLVIGAVTGLVLARVLLPEGRGEYAALVALAGTALAFGHLSVGQAQTALWSPRQVAAFTANSVPLGLLTGTAAASLAAVAVFALGPSIVPVPSVGLLALALAATPVGMVALFLSGTLVLDNGLRAVNRAALIAAVAQCVPLLVLVAAHRLSVAAVMLIWLLAQVVNLTVLWTAGRPARERCDRSLARRCVTVGLRHHVGFVALFLLQRIDILTLNALRPPADVGRYAVAVMVIELARLPADALAQAVTPQQASDDHDAAAAVTARTVRVSALLGAGSALALCAAAPWLLPLAYGAAFAGAVPIVFALAPGLVARAATRPIGLYLLRRDRPWLSIAPPVASLGVAVAAHLALIPSRGAVGAGLACSAGFVCLAVIQVVLYRRTRVSAARWRARPDEHVPAPVAHQGTPNTTR
jgi:O-antigen/teichoic acid export membrane protein